jgi:hypothetical protein
MNTILICLGVASLCFFILFLFIKDDQKKESSFYSVYSPNGLQLIKHLEKLVQENKTLEYLGYMELYRNMFNEIPERLKGYETAIGIYGYDELPENTPKYIAGEYFDNLNWILEHRHRNQFRKLYNIDHVEAKSKFGLNIQSDEVIHEYVTKGVDWFEEKTITTLISYGGYRFNSGGEGLNYTMGSLNVMSNSRNYFAHIDRGSLYITNKRMIFIGKEKGQNRTIDLDDILEFSLFRDGILIGKPNGKKPLVEFPPYVNQQNKAPNQRDHLNRIIRAIDRVMSGTQNIDLTQSK